MSKLTHKSFTALLDTINKGTTERRSQIQDALEFAAYCAQADRNADPAIRLFAVVGRETNRQNMATWLEQNAPIGFKDEVPFFHEKKWKGFEGLLSEFEECLALAPKWWTLKTKGAAVKDTIDVLELIRNLIKSAEGKAKKGIKVEHAEMLVELAAIANNAQYAKPE